MTTWHHYNPLNFLVGVYNKQLNNFYSSSLKTADWREEYEYILPLKMALNMVEGRILNITYL